VTAAAIVAAILGHALVLYAVAAPWLARLRRIRVPAEPPPDIHVARMRMYRRVVVQQAVIVGTIAVIAILGRLPPARLGLTLPRSWWLSGAIAMSIGVALVWSAIRLRRMADTHRQQLQSRGAALLPESAAERRWFVAVGLGGAISEELLFRGFLFYYFSVYLPAATDPVKVVLSSLVFAAGHLYQGWRGTAMSFALSVALAALYALSGSLLFPVLVHVAGNLRGVLILRRPASL
jgi:CAAX protease family protein